jgi:hypothetical protein
VPNDLHDLRERMGAALFAGALLIASFTLYMGAEKIIRREVFK